MLHQLIIKSKNNFFQLEGIILNSDELAWVTESDVNYCAQSFRTDYSHEDAPHLTVLGAVLRNGFLHTAIREKGGAYGSGSIQDNGARTF